MRIDRVRQNALSVGFCALLVLTPCTSAPGHEPSDRSPAPQAAVRSPVSSRCPAPALLRGSDGHVRAAASASETRIEFADVDLMPELTAGTRARTADSDVSVRARLNALLSSTFMREGGDDGSGAGGRATPRSEPTAPAGVGRSRSYGRDAPWTSSHLLADATHMNDEYVSLQSCPTSGNLYCVFQATDLGGTDRDIHIARSQDAGATWQVWEMPSFSQDEYMPELAIDAAGYLYVTWIRDDGIIVRSRSDNPDDPVTWEWVKGLNTGEPHATPTIAVSGAGDFSTVFIAAGWLTVNWDLYAYEWTLIWMYSTNGGSTVTYDYFVPDGYQDYWPDAELSGGTCYLVNAEQDYYTGEMEVLVAADAVSGGFSNPVYCSLWTDMDCGFPSLAADGLNVYAVFQLDYDDGLGNMDGDVIYCYSWDGLANVYGPYEIVADEYESVGPVVYTDGGIVGCLWLDAPPNADEFYLAARQAGGYGHPDAWGQVEMVTLENHVEPTFRSDAGAVVDELLHAAWIDRRDFPTQGLNVYTSERPVLPNLAAFTPTAWEGALVANMVRGERETGILAAGDTAFVSFAFWNDGLSGADEDFYIRLTVDGAEEAAWILEGGLDAGWYVAVEDHPMVVSEPGPHDVGFEIDFDNDVAESDEGDNAHIETLEFVDGVPSPRLEPPAVTHYFEEPRLARDAAMLAARGAALRRDVAVPVVDRRLEAAMAQGDSGPFRVVIVPAERVDPAALGEALDGAARDDRRRAVEYALRSRTSDFRLELSGTVRELARDGAMSEPGELWLSCSLAAEMTADAVSALSGHPAVGALWLDDAKSRAFGRQTGERGNAWHIARVGADDAWSQGYDGDGVVVGHLDSGVAYDHPDLSGAMWDGGASYPNHGWDCLDEDDDPYDGDTSYWHGTHTAGLVAGDGTGGTSTGTAPGASIMALRCVPGYQADMTEALQFALDEGADLVTMSAGWQNADDALKEANRYNADVLLAAGVPWCCAAGNGDNAGGHYAVPHDVSSPGDCPNPWYGSGGHSGVISVGATDSGDNVWSDSSYGPTEWSISTTSGYDDYPHPPGLMKPDVAAPGVSVTSTVPGGYVAYSGTSMATPIVAGAVAILMQAGPGCGPAEFAEALEAGATDVGAAGRDDYSGAGRIDIGASLAYLPASETGVVWLHNDGPVPLIVVDISKSETWLTVSPPDAAVDPGDSVRVTLTFDGTGLPDGLYFDSVVFVSNAPDSPHALPVLAVKGSGTGVDVPGSEVALAAAALSSHPNPFNPETNIRFDNPTAGHVRLSVYDAAGRLVAQILDSEVPAGRQVARWDGRGEDGRTVASGVYFLRLERAGEVVGAKVTLLK